MIPQSIALHHEDTPPPPVFKYKLFVLDRNTRYHINVCQKKKKKKKKKKENSIRNKKNPQFLMKQQKKM